MIAAVLTHPELPGIMAYFFEDGTVVLADPTGRESPAQPYAVEDFLELGWQQQDDAITQLTAAARALLLSAVDREKN